MNQQQRKYASDRIRTIASTKVNLLTSQFNLLPENKPRIIPRIDGSSQAEIVRALINASTICVAKPRSQIIQMLREAPYRSLQDLVIIPPSAEVAEAMAYNAEIDSRREVLNTRISAIHTQSRVALDSIILGDNIEALAAIQAFEGFNV